MSATLVLLRHGESPAQVQSRTDSHTWFSQIPRVDPGADLSC